MSQNPDCPANRSRKTSLPLPKPRPQYGDGRGQPPYAHICSGWKDKKARWETKWGHRSFFPTLILCPASPRIRGRCSSSQRFLSVWTAIRILFFLNMQRVGPCYNPPAQEAENTLVQRAESFFLLHKRLYWVDIQRTRKDHQYKHLFQQHRRTQTNRAQQKWQFILKSWQQTGQKILPCRICVCMFLNRSIYCMCMSRLHKINTIDY